MPPSSLLQTQNKNIPIMIGEKQKRNIGDKKEKDKNEKLKKAKEEKARREAEEKAKKEKERFLEAKRKENAIRQEKDKKGQAGMREQNSKLYSY